MPSTPSSFSSTPAPVHMQPARRPAVFIDKDGTLIENVPYNADPALLRFMPGAFQALAALAAAGYALVVISNQSGLALRKFSLQQFMRLCDVLRQQLQQHAGVALTDFLSCPHAPGADGQPVCACRKPQPWMIERAASLHGLDLARSWMVGDTLDDVEAGHRAGCRALLFESGGETEWRDGPMRVPDDRLPSWAAVAQHILGARMAVEEGLRERPHDPTHEPTHEPTHDPTPDGTPDRTPHRVPDGTTDRTTNGATDGTTDGTPAVATSGAKAAG